MSIVIDTPYRSTAGRKPSIPAFDWHFGNDDAAGTTVVERYANTGNLALQGTLGTSWSANRGFWTPNGTDQHAILSGSSEYAGQDVMADGLLTPGAALIVAWLGGWSGTKNSATAIALCLGRNHSSSASVRIGNASSGPMLIQAAGVGASGSTTLTFGASSLYTAVHSFLFHLEVTAAGFDATAFLDGVQVGLVNSFLWSANGGSAPTRATFALPDGITVGAARGGSTAGSPSWASRLGAAPAATAILGRVSAFALPTASVSTAQALAIERAQYVRANGETVAGL